MYPFVYIAPARLRATREFLRWLDSLGDATVRARVMIRLRRLSQGHAGDSRMIERGLRELRLHFGPGYRVYYTTRDGAPLALAGGDKWSQLRDIVTARALRDSIGRRS